MPCFRVVFANPLLRLRLAKRIFAVAISITLAGIGFSFAAVAFASDHAVQTAAMQSVAMQSVEAGLDPDKPNITAQASAAAASHYDNPSVAKAPQRYQVFLQGVNREWLIESHRIYLSIKIDAPDARVCETQAEQLEKSGRADPFSLGIAMLQRHCAEQLRLDTKKFSTRVEANFSRLLAAGRGVSSLNPIPVFSMREATSIAILLGAQIVLNKPYNLGYADQLVALTLFKFPDAPEGKQYQAFFFDLLAEDIGAGLFRERFRSTQAKYALLLPTLADMDEASYQIKAEELSGHDAKSRQQSYRERYAEKPLLALDFIIQCSVDKSLHCTSADLEPLFNLAEQGDPIAQVALAFERLSGVVEQADIDQGLALLKLAQQKLGSATFWLINASVGSDPDPRINAFVLKSALAGHHGAQLALAVRFVRGKGSAPLIARWQQKSRRLKLIAPIAGMFSAALNPNSPEAGCKSVESGARIFVALCLQSRSQDPPYSDSTMQLLEWETANLIQPKRAIYAEIYAQALYAQGRMQAALEQYLSNAIEYQQLSTHLSELALNGYRSIWIAPEELGKLLDDKKRSKMLRFQFAAGAKGAAGIPWLYQQCLKSASACHALAGSLAALSPEQRAIVIEKARQDDPKSKYSALARDWVFENLRFDGQPDQVKTALAAFESLEKPSIRVSYRYAWQRCGNRDTTIFAPALALGLLPTLLEKSNPAWIQDVGAVCLAANTQFDAATFAANTILALVRKIDPENYQQMTLQKARLALYADKQSPRFAAKAALSLSTDAALIAVAGSEQVKASAELLPLIKEYLQVERATREGAGKGLLVMRKRGEYGKETEYGSDQIVFNPYFLIERRKAQVTIATNNQYCLSQPAGQWRCTASEVSTFALPKELIKMNVIAGKRSSRRCGELDCIRIELVLANLSAGAPTEYSPGLQSYLAVNFEAKSHRAISAGVIDPEGRWLYDYEYDQQIIVKQLPDQCETVAPIATNAQGESAVPVLIIKAEDIKGSFGGKASIAEVLNALARSDEKSKTSSVKLCRYHDGIDISGRPQRETSNLDAK